MRIEQALRKLRKFKGKKTISSSKCHMLYQNESSLIHWLLIDNWNAPKKAAQILAQILEADDWEIDERPMTK